MLQDTKNIEVPEIKDYEIISKIGQGGIAEIFKARQISLNRYVAIKILFPNLISDPDIVKRFDQESVTIAHLNHPNIVHVIDKGETDGRYYFIMEFVDGVSFKDLINSEKYSIKEKLEVIIMVLKALDYAHKNGVIHRDIKPANILVDKQGNAQVADFGIAHIVHKPDHEMTSSDVVMGTFAYMSPEQKISSAHVTPAADLYPVGIIIYEILTGQRPSGHFKLPGELNPQISGKFDDIIKKCLAQDPRDRYQKAVELKNDILNVISGSIKAGKTPRNGFVGVDSFIGKCQFLDTLKESKYSSTMLVENKESRDLFIIKKNARSGKGLKEARLLSSLKHKNIIHIFGAGGDERRMVAVMEYAPGGSLADRMVKPYSFKDAMRIIVAVADALEFAAKNGIIHGNLRPSNILFTGDEEVRVTDFGLPPHYDLMEKNWYAPPEKQISKHGDVFSLGVILHQMLFGKNPVYDRQSNLFLGRDKESMPRGMDTILQKMLAIRIAKRYRSIDEFLTDWDQLQKNLVDTNKRRRPIQPVKKGLDKKQKIIIAVSASVLIIATFLAIYFLR
nr:serine/threonine protein kinase [candidate division Zixibacteria bacterium]